jgi:hypothetical protein
MILYLFWILSGLVIIALATKKFDRIYHHNSWLEWRYYPFVICCMLIGPFAAIVPIVWEMNYEN